MTDYVEPSYRRRGMLLAAFIRKSTPFMLALALSGCASIANTSKDKAGASHVARITSTAKTIRSAVAPGLFELVHANGMLFATSAGDDRRNGEAGHILLIDPDTLAIAQTVQSPDKPFALVANHKTNTLYVGHSMDRRVSVYDMQTMTRKAVIQLEGADSSGKPYRSRQLLVDERTDTVYVSSPSADGPVWIIDGPSMKVRGMIAGAGGPGLTLDAQRNRLYTSGRGFWSSIDLGTGKILARHSVHDKAERFLVNIDVDPENNRLFASDSKHGELLVLDPENGQLIRTINTGAGAMGVKHNASRHEVYVSNRKSGTVTVVNTRSLVVKQSIDTPPFPNSFALSPNGQEVFISIKQSRDPKSEGFRADKKESIAKIAF